MEDPKKNEKSRLGTIPATLVLILTALLLVVGGYFYLYFKNEYTFTDLIDNIVGNLIGVLAAFLLFDILYNKLTQDEYARETSQQITRTLMGDPETLDAFSDEDKKAFMVSAIRSIMKDSDAVDMMVGNVSKYLDGAKNARIRKSYDYTINLTTVADSEAYNVIPGVAEGKYFYVQEKLNFEIKYLDEKDQNYSSHEVKIGFSFDKRSLDGGLLESDQDPEFARCIFNESLDITKEAVDYIRKLSQEQLKQLVGSLFTAVVKIDGHAGELDRVEVREGGIVAAYLIDYDFTRKEHSVRIVFHMPKLWNSIFEVTLVDPTKDPKITFDYMPGCMDVTMYSYLNKGEESNDGAYELQNGLYDVSIKGEWIYPKSGIVFSVRKKDEPDEKAKVI